MDPIYILSEEELKSIIRLDDSVIESIEKGFSENISLVLRNVDDKGHARDPFGRRYHYNPATGEVRSRTRGCRKY